MAKVWFIIKNAQMETSIKYLVQLWEIFVCQLKRMPKIWNFLTVKQWQVLLKFLDLNSSSL